jgi:hypothetical protein
VPRANVTATVAKNPTASTRVILSCSNPPVREVGNRPLSVLLIRKNQKDSHSYGWFQRNSFSVHQMKCHALHGGIRRLPRHRTARTLSSHMSQHNSIFSETLCVASLGHIKGWSASRARDPLLSQQNTSLPKLAIHHSPVSTRPRHVSSSLGSSLT